MTTEELDALAPKTVLFVATEWEVQKWIFEGRIPGRDYYTLTHPPDKDGVLHTRKPIYLHYMDLLNARLDEKQAWEIVRTGLIERMEWVTKKLASLSDEHV
ncbi:hypothetical protein WBJ53_25985 [Spirosoma sp. SC4-14]|uniref:hypothetical protein n=1 Tax=Spirosoma sp. SC4-14 TaxID=3128900 RepID=UPI0030D12E76